MRARSKLAVSATIAGFVLLGLHGAAIEQKPLPLFHVVTADGTALTSRQIPVPDQWLLVYVRPGCAPCDQLIAALQGWESTALLQRTIVIVGAQTPAVAEAYLQGLLPPNGISIAWYADTQGEAWSALTLTGTPVLIGVKTGRIQWGLSGVLNDPSALESVVKTWVNQ